MLTQAVRRAGSGAVGTDVLVRVLVSTLVWLAVLAAPGRARSRPQDGGSPSPKKGASESFDQLASQAESAQRRGESAPAVRLYLKALEIRPSWPLGWRNVGMLLADLHDYPRAAVALEHLVELEPKSGEGWALLGLTEYELGRNGDAYRDIEHGRQLGAGSAALENVAAYHSALILIQKQEFDAAYRTLLKVANAGVDDPDLATAFGLAVLRLALRPETVGAADRDLVDRVGQIELRATHTSDLETMAAYQKLLEERPSAPKLHYAYGNFLIGAGRYDQGIDEMRKEIELSPEDPFPRLQIAMADLKISRPDDALPYAEKAAQLAPQLFAAHYALGWTFYHLGQYDRALPELEATVKLAPDSLQGHYALSVVYSKLGRKDDAARERSYFSKLKQDQAPPAGTPAAGKDAHPGPGGTAKQ